MTRLTCLKRLFAAALLTTGVVAACRAASPGEAPPLAPRPEPTTPVRSANPVPGAPDPLHPDNPGPPGPSLPPSDAGVTSPSPSPGPVSAIDWPSPAFGSSTEQLATDAGTGGTDAGKGGSDGGRPAPHPPRDAGPAPADAAPPTDAPRRPDAGADATVPLDASPIDAYTPELPPVPDAQLPPDAGRPF